MESPHPIIQIIISLIILLLMGYVAYNIYLIELKHMFKGNNDIRKEVDILTGIYDYSFTEAKYNTVNKSHQYFIDIAPSINQEGGAEYSYNFWLYVDQNKITKLKEEGNSDSLENKKDIVLFFKGEKKFYYNDNGNFNCNYNTETGSGGSSSGKYVNLITKNPLVRINSDGTSLAIDYNNILSPDSYQNNSLYKKCNTLNKVDDWNEKNKNMLGIYDITFNNKWFMVTIVMKEVADNNNILTKNRAICKLYINGMLIFESKAETIYRGGESFDNIYSATLKQNKSPFYINPIFDEVETDKKGNIPFFNISKSIYGESNDKRDIGNILKIADLKYYNYAISLDMITTIYRSGFTKEIVTTPTVTKVAKHYLLSQYELDNNTVKEL
jgi:hypothetical protein